MSPLATLLLTAGLAMQASAATIEIKVGAGGLVFSPNQTTAAAGDVLEFHFPAGNHSVTQGDFDNACQPATTGGFFSGYFPAQTAPNPNVFMVTVNNTQPIALYCTQQKHCVAGMVAVINPTNSSSLANFAAAAKTAQTVGAPASVFGGSVGPAPSSTAATTSASASATATTTSSSGGGGAYGGGSGSGSGAGIVGASLSGVLAVAFAVYLA